VTNIQAVPAQTLGKIGQTVQTPQLVLFTGAAVTIWTEPQADPQAIGVVHDLSANGLLTKKFELVLDLSDKAAWAVLVDASAHGVFTPHVDHTVTLQRYNWDGTMKVMAVANGNSLPHCPSGVPREVWDRLLDYQNWYCIPSDW
jgi:hypothetical protein